MVRVAVDCPPEQAASMLRMAVCNGCYDLLGGRDRYLKQITEATAMLCRVRSADGNPEAEEKLRHALVMSTQGLAQILAAHYKVKNTYWDEQIVEALILKPEDVKPIMDRWRADLRRFMQNEKADEVFKKP